MISSKNGVKAGFQTCLPTVFIPYHAVPPYTTRAKNHYHIASLPFHKKYNTKFPAQVFYIHTKITASSRARRMNLAYRNTLCRDQPFFYVDEKKSSGVIFQEISQLTFCIANFKSDVQLDEHTPARDCKFDRISSKCSLLGRIKNSLTCFRTEIGKDILAVKLEDICLIADKFSDEEEFELNYN